ncbi:alpha-glucosidase C-terminal domain-containing protein [Dactylosporangium sp. NPDC050588]|uniref:alpha-glucosidase C-terminal domain-containing protein n=1 Tax=Dactylosporangium sp. NPDC050588 TaxID=3157211 RepID=UPI003408690F
MHQHTRTARRLPVQPDWFRRAVFSEVLTQACFDSNDHGCGDQLGLVSKLDYLRWLGVDCIWFAGHVPVELTGDTTFPSIGRRPYLLTLPGYGSYWFRIVAPDRNRGGARAR